MTILQAYLTGVLLTYLWMCGKDDSADGWVTGFVIVLWFVAIPYAVWCGLAAYGRATRQGEGR